MKQFFYALIVLTLLITSCKKEENPFIIKKQNIGLLTDSTQVKDLKVVFASDSVVIEKPNQFNQNNTIEILDKQGKKLLILTPKIDNDSTSVLGTVQIIDPRFKTEKGISTLSTFNDISTNYKISSIDNLLSSVVISVNEINASFTIDKKELPANARFDMNLHIDANIIPDGARIKYYMIHW